jgi:hypothetical protein
MMQRQKLKLTAPSAGANAGDTGPSFSGTIRQMRWVPVTGDTGADLVLSLLPINGDTGGGWVFYNQTDCLGAQFTKAPRQPMHGADGLLLDTGADLSDVIVGAGDRIRAKAVGGGNAAVLDGLLYVWIES